MPPFYAFARSVLDGTNGVTWRYLMTFASIEDADEWWRIISQPPSPTAGIFQRITPQYYTFKQSNVADFILQQNFVEGNAFQNKMFFTLMNDRDGRVQNTFPQQDITDHASGHWYYIRSKADPHRFWYCGVDDETCLVCGKEACNDVHVSTERRSRFCIRAPDVLKDDPKSTIKVIMIRSDPVTIAPSKDYILQIDDQNELKAVKSSVVPDFVFRDFTNRFTVRAKRLSNEGPVFEFVVPVERGSGENWELAA